MTHQDTEDDFSAAEVERLLGELARRERAAAQDERLLQHMREAASGEIRRHFRRRRFRRAVSGLAIFSLLAVALLPELEEVFVPQYQCVPEPVAMPVVVVETADTPPWLLEEEDEEEGEEEGFEPAPAPAPAPSEEPAVVPVEPETEDDAAGTLELQARQRRVARLLASLTPAPAVQAEAAPSVQPAPAPQAKDALSSRSAKRSKRVTGTAKAKEQAKLETDGCEDIDAEDISYTDHGDALIDLRTLPAGEGGALTDGLITGGIRSGSGALTGGSLSAHLRLPELRTEIADIERRLAESSDGAPVATGLAFSKGGCTIRIACEGESILVTMEENGMETSCVLKTPADTLPDTIRSRLLEMVEPRDGE